MAESDENNIADIHTKLPCTAVQLSSEELKERMVQLSAETSKEQPTEHSPLKFLIMKQKMDQIDLELREKRKEVEQRKTTCDQKWLVLKRKEKELRDKMKKYDSVIEEGKVVRFKALERARHQEREFRQKEAHVVHLKKHLELLIKRNHDLKEKIEENMPALTFLNSVHQEASPGYFESGMDPASAIVKRHQSLIKNRDFLEEELAFMTDKLARSQQSVKDFIKQYENKTTIMYSTIAKLRKRLEQLNITNISKEEDVFKHLSAYRKKSQELYDILQTLDNLSHIYKNRSVIAQQRRSTGLSQHDQIDAMCIHIQEFILHKKDILEHVREAIANEKTNETASVSTCNVSMSTF